MGGLKDKQTQTQKTKEKTPDHLYFPLKRLNKDESIFLDADKGIFKDAYKPIMEPIIGKQLALHTYFQNDLIAAANTRISIDLLKIFDAYKINFKVNRYDVTEEERDHALDLAMTRMIESKRAFLDRLKTENIPTMQSSVHSFITRTISSRTLNLFKNHYDELNDYLEFANSTITSKEKYIATAAALKKVMENEKKIFNLKKHEIGETIEHIVNTARLSLMIARHLDEFSENDYKTLSIICMGHDGGKALIPEEVLYKKGRLTQLENDIMKTHVLLSYILSSNNQVNLDFEAFVMALHHIKEDKTSPQSYSIAKDTHTSFYNYLTTEAQTKLNEIYHSTKHFYRVIGIADTFEAITAERVYKKASSVGKALEIMLSSNKEKYNYYPPFMNAFIKALIHIFFPKNLRFKINDALLKEFFQADRFTSAETQFYKKNYGGVIVNTCSTLQQTLQCMIYNIQTKKVERRLEIPPLFFLNHTYFH